MDRISAESLTLIAGIKEDFIENLEPVNIVRVYASDGKVFAETIIGIYKLKLRLYEIEERLKAEWFYEKTNFLRGIRGSQ